jgi:dipeptidyl aminopeptidase/acylaminoacyl peptidase
LVFLVGADTLGVERFSSTPQLMMGEILQRGQPRVTYIAQRRDAGVFDNLEIAVYPPNSGPDAQPQQRFRLRIIGDTVHADITAGGSTRTQKIASRSDALMVMNASVAMFEAAIARLSASKQDSITVPVFLAAGGQTLPASFRRVSADSIEVQLGPQRTSFVVRGNAIVRMRTPAQNLVVHRAEGAAAARIALGKPDYSAPADAPYRAEHVRISAREGHQLAGTLTIPNKASGKLPVVVSISGSGPQDRDEYIPLVPGFRPFRQIADTLGRRGIAVLRFDDRGTGESGGNFAAATSADFAEDVRTIVSWLRARNDIDPARVALLGHSEGGLIAPIVAASDPRLAGVVLMAGPATRGREILDFQIRYGIDHDPAIPADKKDSAFRATRTAFDTTAGRSPWMRFFETHDPLPTIRRVKQPVLIVQGATDQQVTVEQAQVLADELRRAGNTRVTLQVHPDRNHLFLPDTSGNPAGYTRLTSGKIGPDVLGPIAEWLVQTLKPSR